MTIPFIGNRVSGSERAFLARQLATMLTSGLPIDRAVAVLANQTHHEYLHQVLTQIGSDIEAGLPFSGAIAKHPRVFSKVFVNVVIAGEAVGKLAEVLEELATRLEQEQEFTSKIKGALYYPVFILLAMVVIGIILMVRVIPELKVVFDDAGVPLPFSTRLLIATSTFLANQWWLALLILVLIGTVIRFYLRSDSGRRLLDVIATRLPSGVGRDLYMARFARTLALLVKSGTPIIEALSITAEVMNNSLYAETLFNARDEISRGVPMSVPISRSPLFPLIIPQMILVGEQTGRMDQVLENLADYFEQETGTKIKSLSSLFEPIMIVIVGLGVAFMVFAIFIPIYSIAQFG